MRVGELNQFDHGDPGRVRLLADHVELLSEKGLTPPPPGLWSSCARQGAGQRLIGASRKGWVLMAYSIKTAGRPWRWTDGRRIKAMTVVVALISALGLVPAWTSPAEAACNEDGWIFPYLPQGDSSYGDMGVLYTTTNTNMCTGGYIHQTIHVRLYDDYTEWVEIGYQQDSANNLSVWWAWSDPNCTNGECAYVTTFTLTSGQSLSVNVATGATPSGDCKSAWSLWYFQYALNGNESNWQTLGHSRSYQRICGLAESEDSWYGAPSAYDTHGSLKSRPSGGGWNNWGYIACDTSPYATQGDSTNGYSAYWLGSNAWYATNNTNGNCYVP